MKTGTTLYRPCFNLMMLSFLLFGFMSCGNNGVKVETTSLEINGRGIHIYTIDGCEYIGNVGGYSTDIITHKGNCKFCANRNK